MSKNLSAYEDDKLISMMFGKKSDEELAFNELYNRYDSMLHAYIGSIMKDDEVAEDLVQETFIRFYKTIKKKRDFPNVPGFLVKVARNLCLNHKRDGKENVSTDEVYINVESNDSPDYENKELLELIIMSVEFLDDIYRRAFIYREFEGQKYKDIAEIEGISIANAKLRVIRAKKMIMKTLKPYIKDLSK